MVCTLLASCANEKKLIKYPNQPNDIYANNNLKNFFKTNKSPNIVLRVPNNNDKATSNTTAGKDNNLLYNTIEKELLKEGFSVRDRGLFNELLSKTQTSEYSKIKEITNTDLILEVINIDPSVLYTTNKVTYIGPKSEKAIAGYQHYKKMGASVEFRLIMVKNNEIAGTYKYNYEPCSGGCELESFKAPVKKSSKQIETRETVSANTLEEFIKTCTQYLIKSFRA